MFQDNLKALRKSKGLSQEELAIRLNVVRQTISKWEKGLSVPDADLLIQVAEILEVSVTELLGAKIEDEREIGAVAEQLSRINEQLAISNRRARRIWKGVIIVLAAFALISVLIVALGITIFSIQEIGVISNPPQALPVAVMIEGTLYGAPIAAYNDTIAVRFDRGTENRWLLFRCKDTVFAEDTDSGLRIGRYESEDSMSWVQIEPGENEQYVFIIKNDGLELELASTYIEDMLEEGMLFVFSEGTGN